MADAEVVGGTGSKPGIHRDLPMGEQLAISIRTRSLTDLHA
jgi:hypothetical protein